MKMQDTEAQLRALALGARHDFYTGQNGTVVFAQRTDKLCPGDFAVGLSIPGRADFFPTHVRLFVERLGFGVGGKLAATPVDCADVEKGLAMTLLNIEEYRSRMAQAQGRMREVGVDWLLLGPGSDMRYLTGLNARTSERLNLMVLGQRGGAHFYAPALEAMHPLELATDGLFNLTIWQEDENPIALVAQQINRKAVDSGNLQQGLRMAVSDQLWAAFLLRLQATIPGRWQSAATIMEPLRIIKSAAELAALAEIGAAADAAFGEIVKVRFSGRREVEIAELLGQLLRARGHEVVKFAIVGSGPNGASPHHDAGQRVIEAGDMVVLDFGGSGPHGYGSDISRTVFVAGDDGLTPTVEQLKVYNTVREAQELAFQAIRPSIAAQELDRIARDHITAAGYGEAFLHRLGHGIGLDGHETPYLVKGNTTQIAPGMAFSDEPGIYLAGKFGVRIEDIVYCDERGGVRCNEASRDLVTVQLAQTIHQPSRRRRHIQFAGGELVKHGATCVGI